MSRGTRRVDLLAAAQLAPYQLQIAKEQGSRDGQTYSSLANALGSVAPSLIDGAQKAVDYSDKQANIAAEDALAKSYGDLGDEDPSKTQRGFGKDGTPEYKTGYLETPQERAARKAQGLIPDDENPLVAWATNRGKAAARAHLEGAYAKQLTTQRDAQDAKGLASTITGRELGIKETAATTRRDLNANYAKQIEASLAPTVDKILGPKLRGAGDARDIDFSDDDFAAIDAWADEQGISTDRARGLAIKRRDAVRKERFTQGLAERNTVAHEGATDAAKQTAGITADQKTAPTLPELESYQKNAEMIKTATSAMTIFNTPDALPEGKMGDAIRKLVSNSPVAQDALDAFRGDKSKVAELNQQLSKLQAQAQAEYIKGVPSDFDVKRLVDLDLKGRPEELTRLNVQTMLDFLESKQRDYAKLRKENLGDGGYKRPPGPLPRGTAGGSADPPPRAVEPSGMADKYK